MNVFKSKDIKELEKEIKILSDHNKDLQQEVLRLAQERDQLQDVIAVENELLRKKINGPQNQLLDYYFVSDSHYNQNSVLKEINKKLESGYTVHTAVVASNSMYIIYNLPPKPPKVTIK